MSLSGQLVKQEHKVSDRGTSFYVHTVIDTDNDATSVYSVSALNQLTREQIAAGVPVTFRGVYQQVPNFRAVEDSASPYQPDAQAASGNVDTSTGEVRK